MNELSATSGTLFIDTYGDVDPITFPGFNNQALSLYKDYYCTADPWLLDVGRRVVGDTRLAEEFVPAAVFEHSETWYDFSRVHVGAFHALIGAFDMPDGTTGMFSLHREKPMTGFTEQERVRLGRLAPHLRNAVHLARRGPRSDEVRRHGIDALHALTAGAVIVDGTGLVIFANGASEALSQTGPLRMVRTAERSSVAAPRLRLTTSATAETSRLHALIASAARGGPGGGLVLGADAQGAVLRVLVMPLPDTTGKGLVGRDGTVPGRALVLANTLHVTSPLPVDMLMSIYAFSPSEAAVAQALLGGATAEQVARDRQVSVATIRTQIRSILEKTGAKNVRDLERYIAAV